MDLLDLAVLALRVALVLVLYAFMLSLLRVARLDLRAARPASPARGLPDTGMCLTVVDAGDSTIAVGQVIDVPDGATLGRTERAEIVVPDVAVSAEHARVARRGRDWLIQDLGSTNGTFVNAARVTRQTRLRDGDILTLGSVRLQVALGSASLEEER